MSRQANPVAVGGFVIGAAALAVVGVLVFGGGQLTKTITPFVIYFDGSVQGLDRGAPVMFRGVPVGRVKEIVARFQTKQETIEISVVIGIESGKVVPDGATHGPVAEVEDLVARGMRAQLGLQSLVTGKLYVSLDMHPERPEVLRARPGDPPEIPSIPTELQEVRETLTGVMERLSKLPLEEIMAGLDAALRNANEILSDPQLRKAIDELDDTVVAFRDLARNADSQITPVGQQVQDVAEQARTALEQIQVAIEGIQHDIGAGSPVQYQVLQTLDEVAQASRAVRELADGLATQPNSLIFGRKVPQESK